MSQDESFNPYEPPSAGEVSAPSPQPDSSAQDWSLSSFPGVVWENTKVLLDQARTTNVLGFIVVIQIFYVFATNLPNLLLGQTSMNPFDPDASSAPSDFAVDNPELLILAAGFGVGVVVVGQLLATSMVRPLRRLYFDGFEAVPDFSAAFSMAVSRVPKLFAVGFLWFLIAAVGLLACILPGVVLFFLSWFPIYVAVTTDLGIVDSLSGGWELAKRQWKAFGLLVLIMIGVFGVLSCPLMMLQMIPGIGLFLNMAANVVTSTVVVVFYMALLITIEERDRALYGAAAWETPNVQTVANRPREEASEAVGPSDEGAQDSEDYVQEW